MIGDDEFTKYYAPLLEDMYDVVDRVTINARYNFACNPAGFRLWWYDRFGTFDNLNDTTLMRLADDSVGACGAGRRSTTSPW